MWKKNSELMLEISIILRYHRSDLLFTSDYTKSLPVLVFSSEGKDPNSERLSKDVKCVRGDGCMEFES